jgi:UDP-N-acetylglucosamine 1-carboxyvinyltransferase
LKGTDFYLIFSTVTGTENIMMAATLAEGRTILKNAACEPEWLNWPGPLQRWGPKFKGAGTDSWSLTDGGTSSRGVPHLSRTASKPDPQVAAGITQGNVKLLGPDLSQMEAGGREITGSGIGNHRGERRRKGHRPANLKAVDVKTLPYPGFPTDMQAQIMALMCSWQAGLRS